MDKKAIGLYSGVFALGVIAGLMTYLRYLGGNRSVEAAVAGTNAVPVHLGVATMLALGIVLINRRIGKNRVAGREHGIISGDGGFWKAPFTEIGRQRLLFALLALPFAVGEFVCTIVGAAWAARKMERWRLERFLDVRVAPTMVDRGPARRYYVIGLPVGLLLVLVGCLAIFTIWRSGLQVIGALDPNFCINGWGGPSCLGASLAHWMDAFILFFGSIVVIRVVTAWQGKLAVRLLDGPSKE